MSETNTTEPLLSNTTYDRLKFIVQTVLPALATLYFTVGTIWGLPSVEQVVGTAAALATFGGVILRRSDKTYLDSDARFDGDAIVEIEDNGSMLYSLELNTDPIALADQDEIRFKVIGPSQ